MKNNELFYVLALAVGIVAAVIGFIGRASIVGWGLIAAGAGVILLSVALLW